MMLISRKTCPVLLWGVCVLLSVNSMSVSTPESGADNPNTRWTTAKNQEETTAAARAPSHKPTEVSAATAEVSRMSPTEETEKKHLATSRSRVNTVSQTAVAGAVSTPSVQLSRSPTAATTANQTAPSSGSTTITEGVKQTEGQHQQAATIVTSRTAPATLSPLVFSTQPTVVTEPENTSELSPTATPSKTEHPISTHSTPSAPTASTGASNPATTSAPPSPADFSTQPTVVTGVKSSSELSSTTSFRSEKPIFIQDSTPSVTTSSTGAVNPTSGAAAAYKTGTSPNEMTETRVGTDVSHVPQFSSSSSAPLSSSQSAAPSSSPTAAISTEPPGSSTAFSTSPAANPLGPKKLPNPETKIPPVSTATPRHVSENSPTTKVQSCSSRSTAKYCLIAIACLALLATIFMVSTIVLCTKLSANKDRVRRSQQGTEMMCISALLPERNYSFRRKPNPISNGVLVIPRTGDSDEDGGDNVTLSSFLPDNDRYV